MINDRGGIVPAARSTSSTMMTPSIQRRQSNKPASSSSDEVAILFSSLGTATNSAIVKYANAKEIPHLFLSVNGDKMERLQDYIHGAWVLRPAPALKLQSS